MTDYTPTHAEVAGCYVKQSQLLQTIKVAEAQGLLERKSVRAATTRLTCYTVLKGRATR